MIDGHDIVVRLKECRTDPEMYGMRTTHLVGRPEYRRDGVMCWPYPDAVPRETFESLAFKPSVGLFAICCVRQYLNPKRVSLIGFDSLLGGVDCSGGHKWAHERAILESLGMEVIELGSLH